MNSLSKRIVVFLLLLQGIVTITLLFLGFTTRLNDSSYALLLVAGLLAFAMISHIYRTEINADLS